MWEGARPESSAGSCVLIHHGGQSRLPGSRNPGQLVPSFCCHGLFGLVCTRTDHWSLEVDGKVGARLWAPGCAPSIRQTVRSDIQGLGGIWKEGAPGLRLLPEGRPLYAALGGDPGRQGLASRTQRDETQTATELERRMMIKRHCRYLNITAQKKALA